MVSSCVDCHSLWLLKMDIYLLDIECDPAFSFFVLFVLYGPVQKITGSEYYLQVSSDVLTNFGRLESCTRTTRQVILVSCCRLGQGMPCHKRGWRSFLIMRLEGCWYAPLHCPDQCAVCLRPVSMLVLDTLHSTASTGTFELPGAGNSTAVRQEDAHMIFLQAFAAGCAYCRVTAGLSRSDGLSLPKTTLTNSTPKRRPRRRWVTVARHEKQTSTTVYADHKTHSKRIMSQYISTQLQYPWAQRFHAYGVEASRKACLLVARESALKIGAFVRTQILHLDVPAGL
jgi:hypothetical protein